MQVLRLRFYADADYRAGGATWAERLSGWREHGLDAYCYFDNDAYGYAPANALELKALLGLPPRARNTMAPMA